jgi:plastocyanin
MRFVRSFVLFSAVVSALGLAPSAFAQDGKWVTIKGQIVMSKPAAHLKISEKVTVETDKQHCLSKGEITKNNFVIGKKGEFANVIIYLRPDNNVRDAKLNPADIHPDLANPKSKEQVIDQPCCQFEPRIMVAREGDTLVVKNSAPVNHNFKYDSSANGDANPNIPAGADYKFKAPLKAENSVIKFSCSVHPWMGGAMMVFDHPYFAVTAKDGNFEIKNAPAGKYRIVYRHEEGFHKGKDGRFGFPIEIKAGADGKTMEMKPLEYEFVDSK